MKRSIKKQQGIFHVLMTFMAVPLLALLALAIDGFMIMTADLEQDNNSEYVGLTALREYRRLGQQGLPYQTRQTLAINEAGKVVGQNIYIAANKSSQTANSPINSDDATIEFGHIDVNLFVAGPKSGAIDSFGHPFINAARVRLKTKDSNSIGTFFAKILGTERVNISSETVNFFNETTGNFGVLR